MVVALLGGEALLRVYYEPGAPPHDVELHRGQDGSYRVSAGAAPACDAQAFWNGEPLPLPEP